MTLVGWVRPTARTKNWGRDGEDVLRTSFKNTEQTDIKPKSRASLVDGGYVLSVSVTGHIDGGPSLHPDVWNRAAVSRGGEFCPHVPLPGSGPGL